MKTVSIPALWQVGWRTLLRHRWQSILMVFGIALGVAVVVSIDLANASASRAFSLSTESLTGKATHQIIAGPQGVPEAVYRDLKMAGWQFPAAPLVSGYISSPQLGGVPLQLLGIDPFSDGAFRSFLGGPGTVPLESLTAFLTRPGAVLLSRPLAERYGLSIGDSFEVQSAGRVVTAFLAGMLEPADSLSRRTLAGVVIADIATAQEMTGTVGFLSRIDLILPPGESGQVERLQSALPQGLLVEPSSARSDTLEQMTAAFRVNLTALSLLALVVGLFLIYNTMTFSVVQRRELFGTLRCLGVTRREVFWLVTGEAALVGLVGSLIGLGLGVLLGQGTVRMVSQTINDLYFTTTVQAESVAWQSLVKGFGAGLLATLFTAAVPAWEAASVPPRAALLRSGLESKSRRGIVWISAGGLAVIGLALVLFRLPNAGLAAGFGGTLLVVTGDFSLPAWRERQLLLLYSREKPLLRWLKKNG
ncbi:MAG: FtsX-like permease family protein [Anaerolineae bacterium]|nr:FtsX-like permease family protein [Anaerolineae bacterium]